GRGSRLIPRSPAEAAKKKRFSGQYTTAEIGNAASELQKGQRAIWGPCVEIRGHWRAQKVEQLRAAWCCSGSQGCRSRSYGESRGAEPEMSKAREAGMSR
ncbi:hypothetical protein FOFC_03117, partial [Fusarium oxysporum]